VVEGALMGRSDVLRWFKGDEKKARLAWRAAEPTADVAMGGRVRRVSLVASAGESFASCVKG
jgi:hypothetical protein